MLAHTHMHKSNGSPRLYVHRFSSGRLCNDTNVANYTPFHTNLNQAWEPRALQMVRDVLTEVSDPSLADWFLVDVCLARFYLSMRDSVNPATQARVASYNAHRGKHTQKVGHKDCKACDRLEESLVAEMGHHWVQRPHRHIVSHFRCPRVGRATYPYVPFGRSGLWPSTARGAARGPLVLCLHQADPGVADSSRQVHLPYYTPIAAAPVVPSAERTHDFFFGGSLSPPNRRWVASALSQEAAALVLLNGRGTSAARLAEMHRLTRISRLVLVPPGDTPESLRIYEAIAYGTPPLIVTSSQVHASKIRSMRTHLYHVYRCTT